MYFSLSLLFVFCVTISAKSYQDSSLGANDIEPLANNYDAYDWSNTDRSIQPGRKRRVAKHRFALNDEDDLTVEGELLHETHRFGKAKSIPEAHKGPRSRHHKFSKDLAAIFQKRRAMEKAKGKVRHAAYSKRKRDSRSEMLADVMALAKRLDAANAGLKEKLDSDDLAANGGEKTTRGASKNAHGYLKEKFGLAKRGKFPQTWASLFERQDEAADGDEAENACNEDGNEVLKSSLKEETNDGHAASRHAEESEELSKLDIITYLNRRDEKKESWRPPRPGRSLTEH